MRYNVKCTCGWKTGYRYFNRQAAEMHGNHHLKIIHKNSTSFRTVVVERGK